MNVLKKTFSRYFRFLFCINKKDATRSVLVLLATYFTVLMFSQNYHIYLDLQERRCLTQHVFFGINLSPGDVVKKGDFVSFLGAEDVMMGLFNGKRIAKEVLAQEGDFVIINDKALYINNALSRKMQPETLQKISDKGKKTVVLNRVLTKDEFIVAGNEQWAFDSRYWGVIKRYQIDQKVWPIL